MSPNTGGGSEDDRKWAGVAWEENVPCENMHGAVIKASPGIAFILKSRFPIEHSQYRRKEVSRKEGEDSV